ncbi:MAG: hypothetical protein P0S94_05715, partial [Simkaniaceae bacterium]|nr:hypothetical protein [Simkaniaceae bacterium]
MEKLRLLFKRRPWISSISAFVILFHLGCLVKMSREKPPPPVYIAKRIGVNTKYLPKVVKVTPRKVTAKPKVKKITKPIPKKVVQKRRPK